MLNTPNLRKEINSINFLTLFILLVELNRKQIQVLVDLRL